MSKANQFLKTTKTIEIPKHKEIDNIIINGEQQEKQEHKQYTKGWKDRKITVKATIPDNIKISCPKCNSTNIVMPIRGKNSCIDCNASFRHPKVEVIKNDIV